MMKKLFSILFSLFSITVFSQDRPIDSTIINDYPVSSGIIYKYDIKSCLGNYYPGVTIVTPCDTVFHFSEGEVIGVFSFDGFYCVAIRNCDKLCIAYSGLKAPFVKKGDMLARGSFIGLINEKSMNHEGMNEIDVLILKGSNYLSEKETLDYTLAMRELSRPLSAYTW